MGEDSTELKLQRISEKVMLCLLLAVTLLFAYANLAHYTAHMDADIAGEAVLVKEIAENGMRTPATWYTSSEHRIVYPANLGAWFYRLTGNMNLSMGLACAVCLVVLIVVMLLAYRRLGFKSAALYSAVLLPLILTTDLNGSLEMYALYAEYYFSVLLVTYLMLWAGTGDYGRFDRLSDRGDRPGDLQDGLSEKTGDTPGSSHDRFGSLFEGYGEFRLVLLILCAVLLGMQGLRGVLMVYLPFLVTAGVRFLAVARNEKIKPFLLLTLLSALTAHFFAAGTASTTRNLRHAPEKFVQEVLPALFRLVTPSGNPVYNLCVWVLLAVGIVYPAVVIIRGCRNRNFHYEGTHNHAAWAAVTLTVSFLIMTAAMIFTTQDAASRYGIYLYFAAGAGVGLFLQKRRIIQDIPEQKQNTSNSAQYISEISRDIVESMQDSSETTSNFLSDERDLVRDNRRPQAYRFTFAMNILNMIIIVCACFSLYYNYRALIRDDTASGSSYAAIAQEMLSRGVTKGYATFDHANTTTVISNDAVQVRPVNNMTDLEGAKWLSNATWYPPYTSAEQPVVYITSAYTREDFLAAAASRQMTIAEEKEVGDFTLFFVDRDITVWRE